MSNVPEQVATTDYELVVWQVAPDGNVSTFHQGCIPDALVWEDAAWRAETFPSHIVTIGHLTASTDLDDPHFRGGGDA